jgi:hypothetical protein
LCCCPDAAADGWCDRGGESCASCAVPCASSAAPTIVIPTPIVAYFYCGANYLSTDANDLVHDVQDLLKRLLNYQLNFNGRFLEGSKRQSS